MERLGQHFLKDKRVLERIINTLDIKRGETIVEIGPGHGELTAGIVEQVPKRIIALERDETLVSELSKLILKKTKLEVLTGNAIEILPALHKTHNLGRVTYKIVGNIPYYITGKLLRVIGELGIKPELVVLTVQKEVAERLCSEPPKMNLLAASVAFWGTPEIVRLVSRNAFRPRPKVESAIIKITPLGDKRLRKETEKYYEFIRMLFKQPRKTIANNIADGSGLSKEEVVSFLKSHSVEPNLRPQNLDTDTINNLAHDFPPKTL